MAAPVIYHHVGGQHEDDGPRDHAPMMTEFRQMPTASKEVRAMGQEFIRPFAEGGETADRMRGDDYRCVVDTTIAGLDATLRSAGAEATKS